MLATVSFGSVNSGASVYYQVLNTDKSVSVARTLSGVTELVAGSGIYGATIADSTLAGKTIVWDINGTSKVAIEEFSALTDTEAQRLLTIGIGDVTFAGTALEEFDYGGVHADVTVDSVGNRSLAWS
jgi:hypothetical protein